MVRSELTAAAAVKTTRRTFPDEIIAKLRAQILSGELAPGSRLPPERELAVALGTNRNTLREALRSLEAQGLVQARQGDAVRVLDFRNTAELGLLAHYFPYAAPDEQRTILADLLRLRSVVALEVVARAAQLAPAQELPALEQAWRVLDAADAETRPTAELGLYRALVVASGSITALWIYNSFEKVIFGFLAGAPSLWVTPPSYRDGWSTIMRAVMQRDAKRAQSELKALLDETDGVLFAMLREATP